ncbi:acyltransferase ChoActase/COT/CPT [Fimicolochytrium jonesii]|uniref:acyltransferase ChoActase/COT/CPT n=1 Tax=Fimicolochytrium jonesii TaxID=1396493 RepID=UPI0022FE3D61|nr:acyltransferase ChoActase/COT/CPT [Fimicolochytrium jonesii]KAI8820719.1 acyltransferase ChoActase/COT/CPT [Fimicolochytrium jonesii]
MPGSQEKPPKTFSLQETLPRLPIPPLEETAARYLQTLVPILTPEEYKKSEAIVHDFIKPGGLGHDLQTRLREHDRREPNSWLERWWLSLAYHGWREAVMINSNWYMVLRDHPETPKELMPRKGEGKERAVVPSAGFTKFQVKRAAGLVNNLLDYKDMIDTETLSIDTTRTGPLDMNQYRNLFGITRVPKAGCDYNVGSHPSPSKHIVVLARDQIYLVDVYDATTGNRVTIESIERQLVSVLEHAQSGNQKQLPISLFTALHRDKWAEIHSHLQKLGQANKDNFAGIETALFAVSLDDYILPADIEYVARNTSHGLTGHNRWFDKSYSVCVMADGRTGVNGEHSPCDALIPAIIADHVVKHEPATNPASAKQNATMRPPKHLEWITDDKIAQELTDAEKTVAVAIADSDVSILQYNKYGSDFMKKTGKSSPDAYVQMALQLVFHRIHKEFAAVYETASTRQFKHGRTETCRSLSTDSKAFVEAFDKAGLSPQEKYTLLQKACTAHVAYLNLAGQGRGVDRHLLGLRMVMKPGETAEIYTDPAYAKSSHWRLSTSGLFPGERILSTGFGTVYPDGYGMNYMIGSKLVKIGVESKFSYAPTSSVKFTQTLAKVFDDMAEVCLAVNGAGEKDKAKL